MIKIFAHRGFIINEETQNSIESLDAAFENSFIGVEFDIWAHKNKVVISHDKPKKDDNLPNFHCYLKYGNKIQYWIDFKNIDQRNAKETLEIIKKDLESAKIDLKNVYFAPFIEDFDQATPIYQEIRRTMGQKAQIMAMCIKFPAGDAEKYLEKLEENNIRHLSILHKNIDQRFMNLAKNIEIFAWTVNDCKRMKELAQIGVKYYASDTITPKKYQEYD